MPPDSCRRYSGEGYVWLRKTLEHLISKPFGTLGQEEIFGPLRMAGRSFGWQASFADLASAGHNDKGKCGGCFSALASSGPCSG